MLKIIDFIKIWLLKRILGESIFKWAFNFEDFQDIQIDWFRNKY